MNKKLIGLFSLLLCSTLLFGQLPEAGKYYRIIAKHSGKALDVRGGVKSKANGIMVQQFDANGGDNQAFRFVDEGNAYYRIIAKHSGKALDVQGGEAAKENAVIIQQ